MPIRIRDRVSTKDRAGVTFLHSFAQPVVKARQHNVILVKNMNPMTPGALNASIPSICQTYILGFGVERHPSRA